MSIYVAGSLAFDRIMSFNGAFADHILADKLHILNVSFLIDGLVEKRGGCAGNIAYTLALMGEKPLILATAGKNFSARYTRGRESFAVPKRSPSSPRRTTIVLKRWPPVCVPCTVMKPPAS